MYVCLSVAGGEPRNESSRHPMARKTKQAAQATHDLILDAAERVFERRGVSRTTLAEIAAEAGLTRGAIYWHFDDKSALFNAMVQRVTLPMERHLSDMAARGPAGAGDAMAPLRESLLDLMRRLADEPQVRRVFEIVTHKVEYVDESDALRRRHVDARARAVAEFERVLRQAAAARLLVPRLPLRRAAVGLHALVDGLIRNWMLDPSSFDLPATSRQAIDTYLAGLAGPATAKIAQRITP